ncbi:MAG: hypothetical protein ACRDD1_15080, partial [Planctomycetia bacterium]
LRCPSCGWTTQFNAYDEVEGVRPVLRGLCQNCRLPLDLSKTPPGVGANAVDGVIDPLLRRIPGFAGAGGDRVLVSNSSTKDLKTPAGGTASFSNTRCRRSSATATTRRRPTSSSASWADRTRR